MSKVDHVEAAIDPNANVFFVRHRLALVLSEKINKHHLIKQRVQIQYTGKVLYNKLNKLVTIGLFFYCSYRLTLIFILTKVA